jgi:hypothetical protein
MKRTKAIAVALAIATAAILGPAAQAGMAKAAKAKKTETVTCDVRLTTQSWPTATAPGEDFGTISCTGPFGDGIQYDTFTLNPETDTTGTAELRFKAYFDRGTVSGIWRADYEFTGPTTAIFEQRIEWTGGTGKFKHVRGTGTGTGIQEGLTGTVTQTLQLTGI